MRTPINQMNKIERCLEEKRRRHRQELDCCMTQTYDSNRNRVRQSYLEDERQRYLIHCSPVRRPLFMERASREDEASFKIFKRKTAIFDKILADLGGAMK